jgi:hypothetical protein
MSIFCRLSGRHYWCVPHRSSDNHLVQVCYECGAERPARELQDDFAAERLNHSITSGKAEAAKLSSGAAMQRASSTTPSRAVGQTRLRRLSLIK